MKMNAAHVAGTAALILLGASHVALANEPYLPRSERSFARLDADSDGKMTVNEWKPKAEKRFLRLDDDHNGTVTTAEIDAWLKRGTDRRKERMLSRLDQNKDGSVTRDEVDAYIDALFNGADGDKDGGLTLVEIRENAPRRARQSGVKGN
ncbi:MAG: EF-hand domain-containing protein [Parvibaculaceae bacterium]